MYRQLNERAGISIEKDTDKVPADGKYYVLRDGKIVGSFRILKQAEYLYKKLVSEKNLPPLKKERVKMTKQQLLQQDWNLRSNKALLGGTWRPKGKKSGRYHKSR
jgi:hypothetical protein